MRLRIATRQSPLALWQAQHVAGLLEALDDVDAVELVPIVTEGDRVLDKSLAKIGGKGLFIKELEQAMLDERADLAVHSMKDVPVDPPGEFVFPAVLSREDPRDALVGCTLAELPHGATVGTSSLRRQAQILALRNDLEIKPVRGNVETRLNKCDGDEFAAVILAVAGLKRLGLDGRIAEILEPEQMLPASGQGIVGIECVAGNGAVIDAIATLDNRISSLAIHAERAVAAGLMADCQSPVGAFATVSSKNAVFLRAMVASADGGRILRASAEDDAVRVTEVAARVIESLTDQGAFDVLGGVTT